ncbi:amino acid ABC transporter substrate-binding protein [Tardiphaga sp.]|uniref:amino acid ABC transporter substrate-binding protein n=1 Tax=Tardiphaga sp. TaxID=1926292 RepID=UPI0025F4BC2B|nr:amino acid ABC transporter substrate-binding protein [Tardiphaga sp.]
MPARFLTRSATVIALAVGMAFAAVMPVAEASDVIRFGAPLPLTGGLAPEALKAQQGYDVWVEQVNKAGGLRVGDRRLKVEMVYVDYQSNTPRAVQAAEGLITQDKVDFLFSPHGSGAAKAASIVSEKYRIPTVAATASSQQVFDQKPRYLFGTYTPNATLLEPLFKVVRAKATAVKKVAIYARNDLFPLALAQEMEQVARANGMEVVSNEKFSINALDHASALSVMKNLAPDWIFIAGYSNDNILIRKQMIDQRIEAPVVTMLTGPSFPEFVEAVGIAGSENITGAAWWDAASRYPADDVFGSSEGYLKAFKDKYGRNPDYGSASYSVAAVTMQMAIESAGSLDKEKVRDALAGLNVRTFFGPIKFNASGQADSYSPPVFQLRNGKTLVLSPSETRQGELQLGVK